MLCLELIRVRREDKEEKKRLERMGLSKEQDQEGDIFLEGCRRQVEFRWCNRHGHRIQETGTVREWDLGKDTM